MSLGIPEVHGLRKRHCFTWVSSSLISEWFFFFSFVQDQGCVEIEWRFVLHINKSANRSKGILIKLRQIS